VVDQDELAPGLITRAISSSARSGSGTVVMISAESDARDFVGFSARGVSSLSPGSDLLIAPLSAKAFSGFLDDPQNTDGSGTEAKCKEQCCGHLIPPNASSLRGAI
jgi:hypothetical protein